MPVGAKDKDFDTGVAVQIVKSNLLIASNDNIGNNVKFTQGSYGPFDLEVQPPITKANYSDSLVRVSITRVGHDAWSATIIVVAKFSDNSQVKKEWQFIVDQDVRQTQVKNW